MCGITGLLAFSELGKEQLSNVGNSNAKLLRRGPDGGDTFTDHFAALGHRRLSVMDTSFCAAQPMADASGRYRIVFNGEIFNFRELSEKYLRPVWARTGGPASHSDTEVLLYLLIEHGPVCLPWLSGFFAFAFYDTQQMTLLLARDHFGKKPLLYYAGNDYFAFASEMKALLEWDIPRELNTDVLLQYLQLNYVPQPQSMLQGVAKLKPAHYMRITGNGIVDYSPYYELKSRPADYGQYTYEAAQAKLVALMDASVQERMIADVPLGAFSQRRYRFLHSRGARQPAYYTTQYIFSWL